MELIRGYVRQKKVSGVNWAYLRLFEDLWLVSHCQFFQLDLDGTDGETGLDVFIIRIYYRNLSNFRIEIF